MKSSILLLISDAAVELDLIPALVGRDVGYTLDCHRANTLKHCVAIHAHSHSIKN